MPNPDSERYSRLILPALCIIMAVGLTYVSYQNVQLKKELAAFSAMKAFRDRPPALRAGDTAEPFLAYLPDGQELMIHTDTLSAPLMLAWLSHNCEPCLMALDRWNELASEYEGQVWGVTREFWDDSDTIMYHEDIWFPILTPVDEAIWSRFQINFTPQTMVIGEDGTIGYVAYGPLTRGAVDTIKELMQQPFVERR